MAGDAREVAITRSPSPPDASIIPVNWSSRSYLGRTVYNGPSHLLAPVPSAPVPVRYGMIIRYNYIATVQLIPHHHPLVTRSYQSYWYRTVTG